MSQPENELEEDKNVFVEIFMTFTFDKFGENIKLLIVYLRTCVYVVVKPHKLLELEESDHTHNHIQFSTATFGVTALALVLFGLFGIGTGFTGSISLYKATCLEGDCENGYGKTQMTQDSVYVGHFKNKKAHGKGVVLTTKGEKFVGTFEQNGITGGGVLYTRDETTQNYKDFPDKYFENGVEKGDKSALAPLGPFLLLILYILALYTYVSLVRKFRRFYQSMDLIDITKGAVYHFNFMFFTLVMIFLVMSINPNEDVVSQDVFNALWIVGFGVYPFYYFFRIGKLKSSVINISAVVVLTIMSGLFNTMMLLLVLGILMTGTLF